MAKSDDIFKEKLQFMADVEKRLRRKLSGIERLIVTTVFEKAIADFQASGGLRDAKNMSLMDGLQSMYKVAIEPKIASMVMDFANASTKLTGFAERYYKAEVPDEPILERALQEGDRYMRARLGIDASGRLKPGGYLRAVITDPTMVNDIRTVLFKSLSEGKDLAGMQRDVKNFVQGVQGKDAPSPLSKRFGMQLFDQLQEADSSLNNNVRIALGLKGARYQGGTIETTRVFCCQRDGMFFTQDEMDEWDDLKWSGKKGKPRVFRGGHNCRHQWQWVSMSRLLRYRTDLVLVKGKLLYRDEKLKQKLRTGCEERLKAGIELRRQRARDARAKKRAKVVKK